MNTKEWLAAIGALSVSLNAAEAQQPAAENRAGVTAAVNTTTTGALAGATRTLFIGNDVFREERITTDDGGRAQLLFLDQSAITIGPNAELVIDRFIYDENTRVGSLAVQASRGLLRFVGGNISKQQDVVMRTPSMIVGVRGGISLISIDQNGGTQAIFMFGSQMTVTATQGGQTQTITRPGFGVTAGPRQLPGAPERIPGPLISNFLTRLEAPPLPPAPASGPRPVQPPPGQIAPTRMLEQTRDANAKVNDLNRITRDSAQQTLRNRIGS